MPSPDPTPARSPAESARLLAAVDAGNLAAAAAALGELVDQPGDDALPVEERRATRLRRLAQAAESAAPTV